jgi:hypothetical protein
MMGSYAARDGRKSPTYKFMVASIIIVLVASFSIWAFLWRGERTPSPDLVCDLSLYYVEEEEGATSYIAINGTIYNYGDVGCYAYLYVLVGDGERLGPWSGLRAIDYSGRPTELGWIDGYGDSANVDLVFYSGSADTLWTETLFFDYYVTYFVTGE